MSYQEEIAKIVAQHRDQVESDRAAAQQHLEQAKAVMVEAEHRVQTFDALLRFDVDHLQAPTEVPMGKLTLHVAMRMVMEDAPGQMMRAVDIASEINRRGLYKMRDGRPVEAQQIHARVGQYPDGFGREGTFIKLK